ncbi:SDR family oxidoreductase [Bowmanella dokdonensis]|uniref:SDR family oxidoreductase n=1 Tax=Bowmanella dokdonensis TaxID=751969 RepID=A0A939DKG7_9ALTE|nr:SDR family oxidoreductase [Bowmanella dokdonensis]MBN7824302.1 SDR family oxidoreductase [Bowmanella dokdonensis]
MKHSPDNEPIQSNQPGQEWQMQRKPQYLREGYKGSGKLEGKVAIITGGDSGIGRAIAVHFALEGADLALAYLNEEKDAVQTRRLVEKEGAKCMLFSGDLGDSQTCRQLVDKVIDEYGCIDVLINNVGEQHPHQDISEIDDQQLEKTFRTNIFSYYRMIRAALPHMQQGATIVNTSSIIGNRGADFLIDYAGTKGAIEALTKSMAQSVADKGIRVNCVAPGPIWTPLIPATFTAEMLEGFGKDTPLGRVGEPWEVATCHLFLACADSAYLPGQTLHPNGGDYMG